MRLVGGKGFTIVELLIVVVVIAILAAITIVAYTGIQNRARVANVQASIEQVSKKLLNYGIENSESYPAESTISSLGILPSATDTQFVYMATAGSSSPRAFCTSATNTTDLKVSYAFTQNSAKPIDGRCVRNLVTNPSIETNNLSGWNTPALTGVTGSSSISGTGNVGANAARYTFSGTGSASGGFGPYQQVTGLNSATQYSASVWVRSSKAMQYKIQLELRDSTGTRFSTVNSTTVTLVPGQWSRISMSLPPTASLDRLTFCVYGGFGSLVDGDYVEVDGFMFAAASGEYGYAAGSDSNWSWDGSPSSSSSFGPAERI